MEKTAVIWTEQAKLQLQKIYIHIAKDSILQADKVFAKLVASTRLLPIYPYKFPPDKYKTNNSGNYRAYELFHYRVSYKITAKIIYIVRVRSTYQNPKTY